MNFKAEVIQDQNTGKWGYVYTAEVERKHMGRSGHSGFVYDSQAEAEAVITKLSPELKAWAEGQEKKDRLAALVLAFALVLLLVVIGFGSSNIYQRLANKYHPNNFWDKAKIAFVSLIKYPLPATKDFLEASLAVDMVVNKNDANLTK